MHVVYLTNGFASNLHSSFELSRRLVEAGHRVTYVSPVDVEAQVAAQGLPFIALRRDRTLGRPTAEEETAVERASGLRRVVRRLALRRRIRRRTVENDEIERLVQRLEPDVLLIDIELHMAVMATAHLGIPTFLPIVWFSIFRRPGLPPLHTDLMPAHTWTGRLAVAWAWRRLRLRKAGRTMRRRLSLEGLRDYFRPVHYETRLLTDLKAVARARGFPFRRATDRSQWLMPTMYRHLPVLSYNLPEMEFPGAGHPRLHYVGPMIHRDRREARVDAASQERWRRLLDRRARDAAEARPLVYCSLGSYWSADRTFLRRVLEVFARRPEWDLVLGLGGKLTAEDLAPAPPNAVLLDWAPQLEVLREAACVVTHGGITTINECIAFGVPMVVYSTKHVDQNGCAARVAFHGLGLRGDKDVETSEGLERNIARVLAEPEFRARVAAMRAHVLACERANEAVRLIERAASEGASPL